MIRLAFLGVVLIGGLIAFGGFFLVRGTDTDPVATPPAVPETPSPAPATAQVEKLYFLQDIDLDDGAITVVLFNVGPAPMAVRDPSALAAAQNEAYVNVAATPGQAAGNFLLTLMGAPLTETVAQVFRDDILIGSVSCLNTACGSFANNPDINYAGLLDAAMPIQRIDDSFDDYAEYLSTIEAVNTDPDYMFLNSRVTDGFPEPRQLASMQIHFPTVIAPVSDPLDQGAYTARVTAAVMSVLPDGATIDRIELNDLGFGTVGDKDNRAPVLAGEAPIAYPDVRYTAVKAYIDGTATLGQDALDTLTDATREQYDFDAEFEVFARERLQSDCADCFWILIEGPYRDTAGVALGLPERYHLVYYDLRDTP